MTFSGEVLAAIFSQSLLAIQFFFHVRPALLLPAL